MSLIKTANNVIGCVFGFARGGYCAGPNNSRVAVVVVVVAVAAFAVAIAVLLLLLLHLQELTGSSALSKAACMPRTQITTYNAKHAQHSDHDIQ